MRTSIELNTVSQLALTPQIVRAIRLLQLSAADLEHELEEALAGNPFLERVEPASAVRTVPAASDAMGSEPQGGGLDGDAPLNASPVAGDEDDEAWPPDAWAAASHRNAADDEEGQSLDIPCAPTSLRDHLSEQLAGSRLAAGDRLLVETVIEGLDDDGFLRQSADELLRILPPQLNLGPADFEVAVRYVQSLDPAGVAARSLAECLALQLGRLSAEDSVDAPTCALALRIVCEHLDLLALHDGPRLAQELGCDAESVRRANLLIRSLNPQPGVAYGEAQAPYVLADVIVRKIGGKWIARINPQAVPNIHINRKYADALQRSRDAHGPLAQYLQEARWLIRSLQQRFATIQHVAQAIVDRQRLYLELGELAMRPLVLRDIAREVGLHQSTISRVTSNKYAQTPAGLVELKRFFTARASHGASACSSTAIRALIRELVNAENPRDPLSDVQITHLLAGRGITVARRTVAKYRAALRIAPVESRRLTIDGDVARRVAAARPIAALASARRTARQTAFG